LQTQALLDAETFGDESSVSPFGLGRVDAASSDDSGPIPEPALPPPGKFTELPMRKQIGYVLPVLSAILRGDYPTSTLHNAFFAGERSRTEVVATKHLRGEMLEAEKRAMEHEVKKWLFGRRDMQFRIERVSEASEVGLRARQQIVNGD
jgi:hypothetical protein